MKHLPLLPMDLSLQWLQTRSLQMAALHCLAWQYGSHRWVYTQTSKFENHANVVACLENWPLLTLVNGYINMPTLPFSHAISLYLLSENQNGSLSHCKLWAHNKWSAYIQKTSSLYSLYPLHHSFEVFQNVGHWWWVTMYTCRSAWELTTRNRNR